MNNSLQPQKELAAVCGLFCPSCLVYQATNENKADVLQQIANRFNCTVDEVKCHGCRTDVRTAYCKTCFMTKCANDRNIEFCGECADFPCKEIDDFKTKMPHRAEIYSNQQIIKEKGWELWFFQMAEYYSCTKCSNLNSWYDKKCSNCGNEPASTFVKNNQEILQIKIK